MSTYNFNEKLGTKVKKLLKNPRAYANKILPYSRAVLADTTRKTLESLRIDSRSKPYNGHERLLQYIPEKNGFFVHCGGSDGVSNDPTYYLEKFKGWTGVITEPLPAPFEMCKKIRKHSSVFNTASTPFSYGKDTIAFIDCFRMSFVKGSIDDAADWTRNGEIAQGITAEEIVVHAEPIQKTLDRYFADHPKRTIDLMVIDVECYELEVLQGLDFAKNAPRKFLIEARTQEKLDQITAFLAPFGYTLIPDAIDARDFLYIKKADNK